MSKIDNPELFRGNIVKKINKMINNNKITINLEKGIFNASLNSTTPPATKAAYSPNECPAKAPKEFKFRSSSLHKAILETNIKGCVISVLARSSFLSEKIRDLKSTSKISLASSKVLEKILLLSK